MKRASLMFLALVSILSFVAGPIILAAIENLPWDAAPNSYSRIWAAWSGSRNVDLSVIQTNGDTVTLQVFTGTSPSDESNHEPVRPVDPATSETSLEAPFNGNVTASEIWVCRGAGSGTSKGKISWETNGSYVDGSWAVDYGTFDIIYTGSARSIGYSVVVDEGEDNVLLQVIRDSTYVSQTIVSAGTAVSGIADDVTTLQVSTLGDASTGTFAYYYTTGLVHVGEE